LIRKYKRVIIEKIRKLYLNPEPSLSRKIKTKNDVYRIRYKSCRVIYKIFKRDKRLNN